MLFIVLFTMVLFKLLFFLTKLSFLFFSFGSFIFIIKRTIPYTITANVVEIIPKTFYCNIKKNVVINFPLFIKQKIT